MTRVAVLGLGEAGRAFAQALATCTEVLGWDPAAPDPGAGVIVASNVAEAVRDASAVLSFVPAGHAEAALSSVVGATHGVLYADFATASPDLKRVLANTATTAGLHFVDAAIMAPVRNGASKVQIFASGDAAGTLKDLVRPAGIHVEIVPGGVGAAAGRKLIRSVLVKGLTAVMIESLRAAEREGLADWFRPHLLDTLTGFDRNALARLVEGTGVHAARRVDEMAAAVAMVESSGLRADVSRAVIDVLNSVPHEGIPELSP